MRNYFVRAGFALCAGLAAFGCGESTDIRDFEGYGAGMPGSGLPEGGEILLETISISPGVSGADAPIVFNQFDAYQYGGSFTGSQIAPPPGECFKFQHPVTWPLNDIGPGAEYVDWGDNINLKGPGLPAAGLDIPKVVAPAEGLIDNRPSPLRFHDEGNWIYGGPSWQGENFQDFTLGEGEYTVDVGDASYTMAFPPQFDFMLNNGVEDHVFPLETPAEGMTFEWEAVPNPEGQFQTRLHTWIYVVFIQFPAPGDRNPTPLWICQPPDDIDDPGQLTVPAEVLNDIPDAGIVLNGRVAHFMDLAVANDGEERRMDLVTINCSISTYVKE